MSSQRIETDLRHAVWQSHKQHCAYCAEPLSFSETDIDHIIPKTLAESPELHETLTRIGLPIDFELSSVRNLLPAHRRCNRTKSFNVFSEASIRFYLQQASSAEANVQSVIAGRKTLNTRESLVAKVGEAFRTGLIFPSDLQEPQSPDKLLLARPLVFADQPNELVKRMSLAEVEGRLNQPVLMGGNPAFAAEFADDRGFRMTVRTCKEYRLALAAGLSAMTTYDIESEAFLKTTNAILTAVECMRVPLTSYIRRPHLGVADLDLLPSSLLPIVSSGDEESIQGMKDPSLGDLLGRGELKVRRVSSNEVWLEWNRGFMLREICRADFDGDGIEDIMCECYCWALDGTLGFGWAIVLARTSAEGRFTAAQL